MVITCPTAPHESQSSSFASQALKYERFQAPERLGSSVFGVQGVHRRLAPFVRAWYAADRPRVYMASVDVRKCYDTMKQVCAPSGWHHVVRSVVVLWWWW